MNGGGRWAFLVHPHLGGTWTVFTSLRQGLAAHGLELRWVGAGSAAAAATADPAWAHERDRGEAIHLPGAGEAALGLALAAHLERAGYAGVFVNVLACPVQTNAVRWLPSRLRRIMLVHNVTPGTYAAAGAMRDFVHATVGVSWRIGTDLVRRHGFPAARTRVIPNAVDLARFLAAPRVPRAPGGPLRLLSLGRLEEAAKGIFWLPRILAKLDGEHVHLTVAGDGPDREALAERLAPFGGRVDFLGPVAPAEVPTLCARHDALLAPSRFEGFGQTIVEAMAAGTVPVVSRLEGITTRIVTDGTDGFLFPVGDVAAAATALRRLARAPDLATRMGERARRAVAGRFDLATQAEAYAALVRMVTALPEDAAHSLRGAPWSWPRGLRPGLRTLLPEPLKRHLRLWRERLATAAAGGATRHGGC
ncbi:glycosyltransferase family 4 protein [Benzoatithermus flavus]|uniref:Glycosyltransferase family 4 protein n=1 Tax=Benzoatithermus flavus TaxID=3108223 RepID=A0ABU8XYC3_9PROT